MLISELRHDLQAMSYHLSANSSLPSVICPPPYALCAMPSSVAIAVLDCLFPT